MHTVLDPSVVIDGLPVNVECLSTWGDRLIVGCSEGAFLVLGTLDGGSGSRGGGRLEVIDTRKVQSRKPVNQIKVLEDKQLMLCLTDATVCVYSLPQFELQGQLTRSKGCNIFEWDESRGMLCVATKRRLLLYHHDGRDFVELKDIPVNDVVRCLAWCGDAICLGLKKEYVLVNAATGVTTEVFPTGRSSTPNILPVPPAAIPGPGGRGVGGGVGGGVEELLLARDNVGIFVGADGKPTRKHGLPWTETPTATVGFPPYAVAALPNTFEVRSIQRGSQHGLAQTLPLKGVVGIVESAAVKGGRSGQQSPSSEGADVVLYAFTAHSVVRLKGVPIPSQVGQLLDAGQFEAALLLCDLLVHAPSLRAELVETAHLRCAYERFHAGAYDDAMRHFGAGGASPLEVLALFPGFLPPALGSVVARHQSRLPNNMRPPLPTSADGVSSSKEALAALLPLLLGARIRLRDSSSSRGPDDEEAAALDTAALCVMVATDAPRESVLELLEPPTAVQPAAGERVLVDAGRHVELVALHRAAGQHRRALELLQRLATTPTTSSSGRGRRSGNTFGPDDTVVYLRSIKPSDPLLTLEFSRWVLREKPGLETLELFTTADPPLPAEDVLPHLRMHAAQLCIPYLEHEVEVRGAELPVEFHNDLVLLYLAELTRAFEAATPGAASENRKDSETSMSDMRRRLLNLLQAPPTASRYNPERMLSRFPQDSFFEERSVLLSRVGRHEEALTILVRQLHNPTLAEAYCDRVWSQRRRDSGGGVGNEGGGVIGELDEWLAVNDDATDDAILQDDSSGGSQRTATSTDNVYHSLLGIYLREEPPRDADRRRTSSSSPSSLSSNGWLKEALGLLARRHQYIDGKKVVELLPDDVPLHDVMPFLEAKMRSSAQLKHKLEMYKSLLQSQHDQAEEAISRFKSRSFVITEEATCTICHKKISNSVFGVHPDGSLVHYNCLNR